ncbi:MAG: hydroxymethylglutaryl-CoA lyase [Planctomycetes bacterium]|nr:hydroxymethylglutaryl-CoA lyase [Planctomycetota bacterium]
MTRRAYPPRAVVTEVGPRDGLQNEKEVVPTEAKAAFVEGLAEAGLPEIEVSSFVSPKWVPQLGDAEELFRRLRPHPRTVFSALVPNERGMERALACGVRKVAVFTAATESFSRRNTNASVEETLERFRPVLAAARAAGVAVRGYLSTAFGCPFEGPVDPAAAARVARELLDLGCDEVSVGDTIGVATPGRVREGLDALREAGVPADRTVLHFHDTRGTALANVLASLVEGYASFDSSAGGVGGCPYAPGAGGNLATEDLLFLLEGLGVETGVDLEKVRNASRGIEAALGRQLPGKVFRAGPAPWAPVR